MLGFVTQVVLAACFAVGGAPEGGVVEHAVHRHHHAVGHCAVQLVGATPDVRAHVRAPAFLVALEAGAGVVANRRRPAAFTFEDVARFVHAQCLGPPPPPCSAPHERPHALHRARTGCAEKRRQRKASAKACAAGHVHVLGQATTMAAAAAAPAAVRAVLLVVP